VALNTADAITLEAGAMLGALLLRDIVKDSGGHFR
jgi:hypothetical protein